MNTRRLAPVALAAALLVGMTGCSMISPQATTIAYSAADGVNIPDSGPLKVRNALLVADESGERANFLAAVVNDTDKAATLSVTAGGTEKTVRVPARSTVSLGFDGADPILFDGLDALPGTDLEVTFHSGDGQSIVYSVPVLDGKLAYLADFVPES
ncbi:DNA modification methylase [Microbacterium flavum]|uniref:DNA modification methylase n=1 Tax=Microbacterium flavum TaxID=415216 RepID=A0ABS5XX10_9MICO|nr:DNA modification methylase [Microbacterium flavum]MBT8799067.1 DNA modification methylase [Microbacterium flavum]